MRSTWLALFAALSSTASSSAAISAVSAQPANFSALECAIAQLALAVASAKLPPSAAPSVADALNVAYLCENETAAALPARAQYSLRAAAAASAAARAAALAAGARGGAVATFYVATDGSDANAGTLAAPFATLPRAAAAARAISPRAPGDVGVLVRGGTYYMGGSGGALTLSEADSNVTYAAYPGDALPVVLSGARLLSDLAWAPAAGRPAGTLVAPVRIADARAERWAAAHPAAAAGAAAGPPPLVAALFVDGVRQVRARYPNGNPDDGSGICFSATQRPGEGCAAWSACALRDTGSQPAPAGVRISGVGPDRGDSPTQGCAQCHNGGSFGYTIYPPPPGHPVYNQPLPGVGWTNTSVFSFWGSPFSRPSGVVIDASGRCDAHWSNVNYSSPAGAVVHMFHSGLWGGWMYAVDNISFSAPLPPPPPPPPPPRASAAAIAALFAAMPSDMTLQLKADALPESGDGQPLASWPNSAPGGGGAHGAAQPLAAKQPQYLAAGWPGGLPAVRFSGAQLLAEAALRTPASATLFAAVRDGGTVSDYCSGIIMLAGARYSLCTRAATAGAPAADDDPAPAGARIVATALDWAGSPCLPGHRDLRNRSAVLAAVFDAAAGEARAEVDGCAELAAAPASAASQGYMVGSRNDEMGRYLVGDVGEVLVYPRALNATERAAVVAYLSAKWGVPAPRHCEAPPPPGGQLTVAFGYGGYQEARGSGINAGQRFYIENVLEELDAAGEFFYDARAGLLYLMPNVSAAVLQRAAVAVPLLDAVIIVNGSQAAPRAYATDVSFSGFTITQTRPTFLEMYEVPSGGDWSVHRGAAVFVQDAERVALAGMTFSLTGGNGVALSNHVRAAAITDCEFVRTGDSGIVLIGSTAGVDGSAPTYPDGTLIARNHMHENGVYGKQTSCIGLQLAANSTIMDNVCYNGPRAGVNYNDGFGGGNLFRGNVVFNAVRETGDHGPLNTWDRQPYWTLSGVDDGFNDPAGRSFIRAWDTNEQNLMLNGYNGVWTADHDDSSQFVQDINNVMVFGGCKNYVGDRKNCTSNLILYPGLQGRSAGNRKCQTDDNGVFAEQFHEGNTCVTADGDFYSFSGCTPDNLATTVYVTRNNTLLSDAGASFQGPCGTTSWAQWQSLGQDAGSRTGTTPDVATLMQMALDKLAL